MTADSTRLTQPSFERWRQALALRAPLLVAVSLLGVGLFARSLYTLGSQQIAAGLVRVGWGFAVIVLVAGLREALRAVAWTWTIDGDVRLSFGAAFRARLVGEAFSALLPMGILIGEPAKAAHVGRILPFTTAFAGLALEFFFYSLSLVCLLAAGGVALMVTSALDGYVTWLYTAAPAVTCASAAGAGALVVLRRRAKPAAYRRARSAIVGVGRRPWPQLVSVFGLELAFQVLAVAEVYITLALISPARPSIASAVVLETVGRVVTMAFKYLPMRVGVDEAGAAWFAGLLHLGGQTGVTLAVVRKLRLLFWSAIGLALLGRRPAALAVA